MPNDKNSLDVLENDICAISEKLMSLLLKDHTTKENIFWATDDYAALGEGYSFSDPIRMELITGDNGNVIMPRVAKSKLMQASRSKGMAEVFTPSWLCNKQSNLIDEAWFGRAGVFNKEIDSEKGHSWETTKGKIIFPEDKTWKDYVYSTRLEITCGEAPYLCSRYDTTTGTIIPVAERIGLLDRKLRVVSENTETSEEWLEWAQLALKNIYGYEWQGDSLLIARENILFSFMDFYKEKFGKEVDKSELLSIAEIITWNIWQMDGLKCVVPKSCRTTIKQEEGALFSSDGEAKSPKEEPCPGCAKDNIKKHNGKYCYIMDWKTGKAERFVDLLKGK